MPKYEIVREIFNHCPNNQMRDIFFLEAETDDPVAFVRSMLRGGEISLSSQTLPDGTTEIMAVCDGIRQRFLFTEDLF